MLQAALGLLAYRILLAIDRYQRTNHRMAWLMRALFTVPPYVGPDVSDPAPCRIPGETARSKADIGRALTVCPRQGQHNLSEQTKTETASMYVCICKAVTESQICDAISRGLYTREAIAAYLKAGTACGKCKHEIGNLLLRVTSVGSAGVTPPSNGASVWKRSESHRAMAVSRESHRRERNQARQSRTRESSMETDTCVA